MHARISEILRALTDSPSSAPRLLNQEREELTSREVSGFSWDSRSISVGDMYVALIGERVDGHSFIPGVIQDGAACALVSREVDEDTLRAAEEANCALILVPSVECAFTELAMWWRTQLTAKIYALTGSSGKTTTKTLMAAVLAKAGKTIATLGNQNNELGIPATVLRAERDTEYLVVEIGMRGAHQIDEVVTWLHPDAGLVTNVGTSHIELLGSREAIADAKSEIFHGLSSEGYAFINSADDFAARLVSSGNLQGKNDERIIWFSGDERAPLFGIQLGIQNRVWVSEVTLDAFAHPSFTLRAGAEAVPVVLKMSGKHAIHNACAAAAVGLSAGLGLSEIAAALGEVEPLSGRSQITMTPAGVIVIDDAYNANPDSMGASLRSFAAMAVSGRRVCVLGNMGELGSFEREGHTIMGTLVAALGFDYLISVGDVSEKYLAHAAAQSGMNPEQIVCVSDAKAALSEVARYIRPGDAVLVKASHSVGLSEVVEGLVR